MDKITFTLKGIRQHRPCGLKRGSGEGYDLLRKNLGKGYGDKTPITIAQIHDSNGYDDARWCLCASGEKFHSLWRHFKVDCAKQVEHLIEDESSKKALVVARDFADSDASDEDLGAVWDAAWANLSAVLDDARADLSAASGDAVWDAQMRLLKEYCRLGERPANSVALLAQFIKEEIAIKDQTND
jgi:hypothetical protein